MFKVDFCKDFQKLFVSVLKVAPKFHHTRRRIPFQLFQVHVRCVTLANTSAELLVNLSRRHNDKSIWHDSGDTDLDCQGIPHPMFNRIPLPSNTAHVTPTGSWCVQFLYLILELSDHSDCYNAANIHSIERSTPC